MHERAKSIGGELCSGEEDVGHVRRVAMSPGH